MCNRMKFNEVPELYDKFRPTYTTALFSRIIGYVGLDVTKNILEVGMGTGQATTGFLSSGCKVTAVELGEDLVGYSKSKFMNNGNVSIICGDFEKYDFGDKKFDLLYSGTAFHWINESIGYKRAYELLKPGGSIALFWNKPCIANGYEELDETLQNIYRMFDFKKASVDESTESKYYRRKKLLLDNAFEDIEFEIFNDVRSFSTEEYIGLLNTYSDHRALEISERLKLETAIIEAISDYGGDIKVYDTIDLYLGRKPII